MDAPRLLASASDNETGADDPESVVPRFEFVPEWVPDWGLELVASVLVIVLAWLTARLLVRLFGRRIARHVERPSLTRVALAGIRVGVYVFALLTILRINGLDLGSIALSVTVFSAVVGIILAPIVGSIIGGMFLLADQPYEIGDLIELTDEGTRGFVEDITLRYTKIFTLDNTFLVIPNGVMRERDVVNYSAEDSRVRLTLRVLITYESDVAEARERMEQSARQVTGVITGGPSIRIGNARYPASPTCLIEEFADNGILLRLRYWVKEPYRIQTLHSRVQTNIWEAFEDDAVEMAYPHSHLVFDETSGELPVTMTHERESPATPDVDLLAGEAVVGTADDNPTERDAPSPSKGDNPTGPDSTSGGDSQGDESS